MTTSTDIKERSMYTLNFTSVPRPSESGIASLDEAYKQGLESGFEFSVWRGSSIILSWSVFGGRKKW